MPFFFSSRPIRAPPNQVCEFFEVDLIDVVKPVQDGAVDVDDAHHAVRRCSFSPDDDGHDNFGFGFRVARYVTVKGFDVRNQLRPSRGGGCPADAAGKVDELAGYFALEGRQDQGGLLRVRLGVEGVEAFGRRV